MNFKLFGHKRLIHLLQGLMIVVIINYIASFVFYRLDLTSDKRYSLSETTKEFLSELDDIVFVRVYLDGELPAGFTRLKNSTKELLNEFRAYANNNIEYEFINPSESPDAKTRNEVYELLSKAGLQYTNLEIRDGEGYSEKIIFPGAIVSYKGQELPIQLLKNKMGEQPEVMLNNSIQQLEYEFSSTIKKLTTEQKQSIGFIEGHGELDKMHVADISLTLKEYYNVKRVKINGQLNSLVGLNCIIIAKPDSAFSEKDKFIIDQFIMKWGKVLWLVESIIADMDSLINSNETMSIARTLNLEDQLFKYGVRINTNLVMDLQALPIPIVTGYVGNQPKQELFPWFYFPLLMTKSQHPIVKDMDAIKTEFVSSIDTVGAKGITKTILLTSSPYTKLLNTPARISLDIMRKPPDERQFVTPSQAVAVLLEGEFESIFKNRIPPEIENNKGIDFKEKSEPNKMIVISDGDIIKNQVKLSTNEYFALGYDRYTNQQYGNKDFLLNAVNYLCDDSGMIDVRGKEMKLRLLDRQRIQKEKTKWQMANMIVPIVLVLLFGLTQWLVRRKKYKEIVGNNDKFRKQNKYFLMSKMKSTGTAYLCWFFFGCHYAYLGRWGLQIFYWITLGGMGIWLLIDLFHIHTKVSNHNYKISLQIEEIDIK